MTFSGNEGDHGHSLGIVDLSTRDGFVEAIRSAGRYIEAHAENLLGEYPSLLCGFKITADFSFECVPTVKVERSHIVCDESGYPKGSD